MSDTAGGTSAPSPEPLDNVERALFETLRALKGFVDDETKKAPELEHEVKRLIAKSLEEAIPAILTRVLEQLALTALPAVL